MGRIRTIKPEFWEDDRVGQLSPLARLVFIGSWNLADDAGRLRWSPDYINASLFMYDRLTTKKVAALMAEVEAQELVVPYEARGQQLAYVPGWAHQRIDKPQPPRFPPPPGVESTNESTNDSGNESGNSSGQERKGREGIREGKGGVLAPLAGFDAFWAAYPPRDGKRLNRAKAEDHWKKLTEAERVDAYVGAGHLADAIAAGGKFGPPDPDRWLRDRRWTEWQEPARVARNGNGASPAARSEEAMLAWLASEEARA